MTEEYEYKCDACPRAGLLICDRCRIRICKKHVKYRREGQVGTSDDGSVTTYCPKCDKEIEAYLEAQQCPRN